MPCRVDEPFEPAGSGAAAIKWRSKADQLTAENDLLREAIIGLVDEGTPPSPKVMKLIEKNQITHRKEDLKRLEKTFRAAKDAERLGKTMLADPTKPLEPQLGFDPDAY